MQLGSSSSAYVAAGALGLGLGAALRWLAEAVGATPLALTGGIALCAAALGAGHAQRMAAGRPGSRLLLAAAAPLVLWLLTDLGRGGLFSGLVFAGATWGRVASPSRRGAGALAVGAVALIPGFFFPLVGVLGGLALLAALDLRPEPRRSGAVEGGWDWVGAWGPAVCLALSTGLFAAVWTAARGMLDPTPFGLVIGIVSAALGASVAASLAPRAGLGAAASALGLAAVASRVMLSSLPYRSALWLSDFAGSEDPRPVLAAGMAALCLPAGLAAGVALPSLLARRAREGTAWVAVAGGLVLGVGVGPALGENALVLGLGAGLVGLVRSARIGPRLPGLVALGVAAWAIWAPLPWPDAELGGVRFSALRDSQQLAAQRRVDPDTTLSAGGWGPDGSVRVELREDTLYRAVLEGHAVRPRGRMADAERLAGHLAVGLVPNPDRALVLGDDLGLVTEGLVTQLVERIVIAVPDTQGLRALAGELTPMQVAFFDPSVLLVRGTNEQLVRERGPHDVIIEVARTPWLDGRGGVPGKTQLKARRDALSDAGAYLLVLDLSWLEEEEMRGIVADFVQTFRSAQAFLPPQGGDQVLLAGWKTTNRIKWGTMVQAATLGLQPLTQLGIRSPTDFMDRGIVGTAGLTAFSEGGRAPARMHLPGTLHRRPRMLLPLLEPHVEGPDTWLDNPIDPKSQEELRRRSEAAKRFLQLLAAVPEGDMPAILAAAKELDPRSLDPLIEPHMNSARELIARGLEEGPTSMAWADCIRQLETARLVSPRSPDVLALMGRCHMVQDPQRARGDFEAALEHDPSHLDALLGLAQLQMKRGERAAARENLTRATTMHPRQYEPLLHLAAVLMEDGLLEDAEDHAARAKVLAGDESCSPLLLIAHIRIASGDPQGGLTFASSAEQTCGGGEAWYWKGVAYGEMRQMVQAKDAYKRAVLADPGHYPAHYNLGLLDLATNPCAALTSFNTAKALAPMVVPDLEELRDTAGRSCNPE